MDIKIFVEPDTKDGTEGQQCRAYIIYKAAVYETSNW